MIDLYTTVTYRSTRLTWCTESRDSRRPSRDPNWSLLSDETWRRFERGAWRATRAQRKPLTATWEKFVCEPEIAELLTAHASAAAREDEETVDAIEQGLSARWNEILRADQHLARLDEAYTQARRNAFVRQLGHWWTRKEAWEARRARETRENSKTWACHLAIRRDLSARYGESRTRAIERLLSESREPNPQWLRDGYWRAVMPLLKKTVEEWDRAEAEYLERERGGKRYRAGANLRVYLERDTAIQSTVRAASVAA